jgi:uncharacterized protein YjbI with pentapeptide repeats
MKNRANLRRANFTIVDLTDTNLTDVRWSEDIPVLEGWIRDLARAASSAPMRTAKTLVTKLATACFPPAG